MEGIYKTKIRESELADLVRKTLGIRMTGSRELTGGWANNAYALEVYFSHFNRSPAFLRGYGKPELSDSEFARRSLYDLYLDLILYVECTFRQYDDEGHVRWASDNLTEGLASFMNGRHR